MVVLAATAEAHGSGTHGLAFVAGVLAFGLFIFWAFGRRIGGAGGGGEKASVGAWFLLVAVIIGILMASGGGAGSSAHSHGVSRTHEVAGH